MEHKGYTYIMTNASKTALYVGVTNSLKRRSAEHKLGTGSAFTAKYKCSKLVYYEQFPDIQQAIAREKTLKKYNREWKINLIKSINPKWEDLSYQVTID